MFNEETTQMIMNLNGIMLKKAEIEGSMSSFYLRLFEKIYSESISTGEEFLIMLGQTGG